MGLLRLILIINLVSFAAYGSGEFGFSSGVSSVGTYNYKFFFNVYENLGGHYYINPYYQYDYDFNFRQHYFKLDLNKHIHDKIIVGFGIDNIHNNYFMRQHFKFNVVFKLW